MPIGFFVIYVYILCMKIESTNKTSVSKGVSKTKKKSGVSDTEFSSLVSDTGEASNAANISAPTSIGGLDALLAVQEDGRRGSKEANERAKQRADELLDKLEGIKMDILSGGIPKSSLQELSNIISKSRDGDIDPQLADILDEIDLRAQVELAKLDISIIA